MASGGRKYRLVLYEHMLDRWWPATLTLALVILGNVGVLWGAEWYFAAPATDPLWKLPTDDGTIMLAVGGIALLFTIFLLIARKMAYVQLFTDHFQLATPFFRLNISYKRIQRTTTAQVSALFPPKSLSGQKREIIVPISGNTALVVHLTSYPIPRSTMKYFLSPFFFYDDTPHFVFIVKDWMKFSSELESRRVGGLAPRKAPAPRRTSGLLDDLKKK
jgi:hypothetical protein